MQDLKVTIIQTSLYWETPQANLSMLEEKIWKINEPTDLIVLPEMFTTGFSMNVSSLSEPMNMTAFKWMKQMASQTKAVVAGSVIIRESQNYFNRLIWMQPDGTFYTYDKRHLFRMGEEDKTYSCGSKQLIAEIKGWKVMPLICYDLRFPVWSRNVRNSYDLLIYVANWPSARRHAWNSLLKARAIENLSYVIGVNRTGRDGKGLDYSGDSVCLDFKGEDLCRFSDEEEIKSVLLNYTELTNFRNKFPAYLDSDEFSITV